MAGDADDDVTDAKVALALTRQVPTPGFGPDVGWKRQARPEKLTALTAVDAPGPEALPAEFWTAIRQGAPGLAGLTPLAAVGAPLEMHHPTEVVGIERDAEGRTVVHTQDCMPLPDIYAPSAPALSARTLQQDGWIPEGMRRERGEVEAAQTPVDLDANSLTFERQAVRQAQGFVMKDAAMGQDGCLPPECNQLDSGRSPEMYVNGGYAVNHSALVRPDLAAPPTAREQNEPTGKFRYRGAGADEDTQAAERERERVAAEPLPESALPSGASERRAAPLRAVPAQAPRRRNHDAAAPMAGSAASVADRAQPGLPTQAATRREQAAASRPLDATAPHGETLRGAATAPLKHALKANPLATGRAGGTHGLPIQGELAIPRHKQHAAPRGNSDHGALTQAGTPLRADAAKPLRRNLAGVDRPGDALAEAAEREHGRVRFASRRQHTGAKGALRVAAELPGVHGDQTPAARAERLHEDSGFADSGASAHQRRAQGAHDTRGARRRVVFAISDAGPASASVDADAQRAPVLRSVQEELEGVTADTGSRAGAGDGLRGGAHTQFAKRGGALVHAPGGRDRLAPDAKLPGLHTASDARAQDAEAVAALNTARSASSALLEAAPGAARVFAI